MDVHRAATVIEPPPQPRFLLLQLHHAITPNASMAKLNQESRINLALVELRTNKNQSVKAIADRFELPRSTLRDRLNGTTPRPETRPNRQKLDKEEEEAIIKRLLYIDDRGYSG